MKQKLLLRCGLAAGDIVMMTAAVRDLHHCYPGRFITDVRTSCREIWENNPYLSPLSEHDPEVRHIECSYPLIDRSNKAPYHCLHGFVEFLNEQLDLAIKPTVFKGDIHLSDQEKAWFSQVHEFTGKDIPFWIVAAGGKFDITIKWWETKRYQQVLDHFRGKIQFVQIGDVGHHHPKLEGAIDLRGRTSLRELIRLVYHAQGILCSVTALMHLAAAVEVKSGATRQRPCVVVAGGREPAHWEAYPSHQFLHTTGALACCAQGGCWKDRFFRLRDGDRRDRPDSLCTNLAEEIPKCLDLITANHVIEKIELYFRGRVLMYLKPSEIKTARRGVASASKNPYDNQPLTIQSAGLACDQFVQSMSVSDDAGKGRGIVICGGGIKYFTNAWVCVNMLRKVGCNLPVEMWHLGRKEMGKKMRALLEQLDVRCVDADEVRKNNPVRILSGWGLKPYSILHSGFREVLYLDADNVPVADPTYLFETPEFKAHGAIFWPDFPQDRKKPGAVWRSCGLRQPEEPEFESGQMLFEKQKCLLSLRLSMWFNENSDFYYQYIYGDKETFHLAFRKLKKSYALVPHPIHTLAGTMCQHDFEGVRIFQHRNTAKWDLFRRNKRVNDFWLEKNCIDSLARLKSCWSGRVD